MYFLEIDKKIDNDASIRAIYLTLNLTRGKYAIYTCNVLKLNVEKRLEGSGIRNSVFQNVSSEAIGDRLIFETGNAVFERTDDKFELSFDLNKTLSTAGFLNRSVRYLR